MQPPMRARDCFRYEPTLAAMIQTIGVEGMTCANCVRHVRSALETIPGVRELQVDLDTGSATFVAEVTIERSALAEALDEAGYALR